MILEVVAKYKFVIFFYSFVVLFVYLNRNKFDKQGSFIYLYRTKFGLSMMDRISKTFNGFLKILGYLGVIVAYAGFFLISYLILRSAYDIVVDKPEAVGAGLVVPGLPIAGLGIVFPLFIGWISLFIIIIVHEFSHGVIARVHGVK